MMHHSWNRTQDTKDDSGNVAIVKDVILILQNSSTSER
jgi:hypothetical protein